MTESLIAALCLVLGGILGWWLGSRRQRVDTDLARDALDEEEAAHEQTREVVTRLREGLARSRAELEARVAAEGQVSDRFRRLAADALAANNRQFLALAETRLSAAGEQHEAELEARQDAIADLIGPLDEHLQRLDSAHRELERQRTQAAAEVDVKLGDLAAATRRLDEHSRALATALRGSSSARGRWGEMTLRRVVELAGMTAHCDFEEQVTDAAGQRPDMVVLLPGDDRIPVDAKAPLADYLAACDTDDEAERGARLEAHGKSLAACVRDLVRRDYARQLPGRVPYTVLFLPAEPMLAAAFEVRPRLQQEAAAQRVLIVTPVTLLALLHTVAAAWRQEAMADGAQAVWEAAQRVHERCRMFAEHLGRVGQGLGRAVDDYNRAVGSYTSRVLPAGRALEDLQSVAQTATRLTEPATVDAAVRELPGGG